MNTFRNVLVILLIGGAIGLSGCFEDNTVINVHKDGSATITKTTYFSDAMLQMVADMAKKMESQGAPKPKDFIAQQLEPEKLTEKAGKLGQGVTVKSSKALTHSDGRKGVEIVFAVADVTKLNMQLKEDRSPRPAQDGQDEAAPEPKGIRFLFAKGDSPTVTVLMPQHDVAKKDDNQPEGDADADETPDEIPPQMAAMFKDMRMSVTLKVDGKITATNASSADKAAGTVKLFYMDIGGIMADPDAAKKLKGLKGLDDPWKAQQKFKALGLEKFAHVETQPKVTVTFK